MTSPRRANPLLREHLLRPRNCGSLEDATGRARVRNPICGDVLDLAVREREGRLEDVRFRAEGCSAAIAVASILTELTRGATGEEARRLDRRRLLEAIGPLPRTKHHAVALALDALRGALTDSARGGGGGAQASRDRGG